MREFFAHGSAYSHTNVNFADLCAEVSHKAKGGTRSEHGAEPMRITIVVSPTFSRKKLPPPHEKIGPLHKS